MRSYGSPSYAMGADDGATLEIPSAATTPITAAQAGKARAELAGMKRSLRRWLQYRTTNDQTVAGGGRGVRDALLKRPGAVMAPASVMAQRLRAQRLRDEQPIASDLYRLLSEAWDPQQLPDPDLSRNPAAAVQLAQLAIAGALPGEQAQPSAVGFLWMWPAVVVVGVIALVITTAIRSSADVAKERERMECIQSGKCTDYGFWLKAGGVVAVAWFAWDKLGLRERVASVKAPGRRR